MDHLFEYRAHYNAEGKPCHCPWGWDEGGEHLGSVKESSKFDWLKERSDMQSPEGKGFLRYMDKGGYAKVADKLLPWLAREWKKGRISLPYDHEYDPNKSLHYGERSTFPLEHRFTPYEAEQTQKSLEEMSKRRQGVDVMQHKIHELMPKVQEFQDWKKTQSRKDLGEILHQFPDGWSIRRLNTPEEFKDEGNEMGHCLGEESDAYHNDSENGNRMYVSLRDHKNIPHATMELEPDHWVRENEEADNVGVGSPGVRGEGWEPQLGDNSLIHQFYGKEDNMPLPEYQQRMSEWLAPYRIPFEWEDHPEAQLWRDNHGLAPAIAASTRPLYYRWVYSPSKGVTLNSNQDDHPALVKYHTGLSGDINDTDLSHGYASPIENGWRITDIEHQPVEDPYIVQQVVRRLNTEDGPQIASHEGSWAPSEFNWDRLHYSLPCEKLGSP